MPYRLCLALLTALTLWGCSASELALAQSATEEQSALSAEAYRGDIDELASRILKNHPQPYEFISEAKFGQLVSDVKSRISDRTTPREFIWMFNEVVASIGCGHTTLEYFNQEDALLPDSLRFPIDARFVEGRLYVLDPLINGDVVSEGEEILSINGVDVSAVRAEIFPHVASDAYIPAWREQFVNSFLTAYVAYAFDATPDYEVVTRSSPSPIRLRPLTTFEYKPIIPPSARCQDRLCAQVLDGDRTAIVTIRSWAYYGDAFPTFTSFVDSTFSTLAERGVRNLLLDLRGNGGGTGFAASYLLQRVADRPFVYFGEGSTGSDPLKEPQAPSPNRFTGDVFVLADGGSRSATGHFLSLVKANRFATILGEESGATFTVNDNTTWFEASNSGIRYRVARSTFYTTAEGLPNTRGVLPDQRMVPSIDDLIRGDDSALRDALALIRAE